MIWVAIGLILIGVQALIIGIFYGARRAEREADRPTPGAGVRLPDLSDVLRARLAVANRLAEANTATLDTVEQHYRTVPAGRPDQAGLVAAALAPDSIEADTAALIRQAEAITRHAAGDTSDIPTIPGDQP